MHYLRTGAMDETVKATLPSQWVKALFQEDDGWSSESFHFVATDRAALAADLRVQAEIMDEELFVKEQRVRELNDLKRNLVQEVAELKRQKRDQQDEVPAGGREMPVLGPRAGFDMDEADLIEDDGEITHP